MIVGLAVHVYHVERGSGHDHGSRDRAQSRDWCAFAANGIGAGPDGSGRSRVEEPVFASKAARSGNRQSSSSEGVPNTEKDCRLGHHPA